MIKKLKNIWTGICGYLGLTDFILKCNQKIKKNKRYSIKSYLNGLPKKISNVLLPAIATMLLRLIMKHMKLCLLFKRMIKWTTLTATALAIVAFLCAPSKRCLNVSKSILKL